jgi:isoleucyl-tRNA synthetase
MDYHYMDASGQPCICVNPGFTYVLMKVPSGDNLYIGEDLAQNTLKQAGIEGGENLS